MKRSKATVVIHFSMFLICLGIFPSCDSYLDEKPLISLAIPETLADLQALLDNAARMNESSTCVDELLTTDFYVEDAVYNRVSTYAAAEMQLYLWEDNGEYDFPWSTVYQTSIYYANTVLDALDRIPRSGADQRQYDLIKGRALFHRAFSFHRLAQLYAAPYSDEQRDSPGIVLKLTSNINERITRATIGDSYERILKDIEEAATLLQPTVEFPTCPNKAAAFGLLARVYLSMRKYEEAKIAAGYALEGRDELLDYNELLPVGLSPIPQLNREILFHSTGGLMSFSSGDRNVSEELFDSYDTDDLRRELFFVRNASGLLNFQGSYNGSTGIWQGFDGVTTAEILLIDAECAARAGNTSEAMAHLNQLLVNRYAKEAFTPLTTTSASDALGLVLSERRKELIGRGLRWSDLRRLNLEGRNIGLVRTVNGTTYQLPAGAAAWMLKIPQSVLEFNPSIK